MNTPRCDHCRKDMAFGIFELTVARTGAVVRKNLCADCGFNVHKYRTMKLYQFERTYTPPTGGTRTMQQEVMSHKFLYAKCDLIETFTGSLQLAKLDQELRAEHAKAEQEARIENMQRARSGGRPPSNRVVRPVLVVGRASPRGVSLIHGSESPRPQVTVSSSDGVRRSRPPAVRATPPMGG